MEELSQLKKRLEKAIAEANEAEALDIIRALDRVSITVESLAKTKLGLAVGKLRKHDNKTLAAEATTLVTKWKKAVAKQTPPKPNFPSASAAPQAPMDKEGAAAPLSPASNAGTSSSSPRSRAEAGGGSNEGASHKSAPAPSPLPEEKRAGPAALPAKKPSALTPSSAPASAAEAKRPPVKHTDAARQRCFEMLAEALAQSESEADHFELALDIEAEMFKLFGSTNANYKAKFRQLFMNLKNVKNSDLRLGVLNGHIAPENLCQMSSQELASKELQQQRKALEEACLKEAIRGGQKEATTNMFRCHKCKMRECTYFQLQTRSADEPMTTFVTCTNCSNRWKF